MLRIGDRVRIRFPKGDLGITRGMRVYDGAETTVSRIIPSSKTRHQIILDGCMTEAGMPYFFVEEWLITLDTEDEVTA